MSLSATYKMHDNWVRFIGIPLFAFMGHIIFYNRNDYGEEQFGFWGIMLLSMLESMLLWEANRLVIRYFRNRFPALSQTSQRIIAILITCTILTIILRSLNIYFYDKTRFWGYQFPVEAYLHGIFVALLFVIILGGLYEAVYYFRKWKDMAVEAEALKKENLQTQLDTLKRQLSPHFLFNSLGSLSSLIEEDPAKAQDFVSQMSTVYRYLLQSNESNLTTLQKEMDFIFAYSQMLLTRFPEGLKLEIKIDNAYRDFLVPPLTVQLLLENAVKHNAVLPSRPLTVKVYTTAEGQLVVENNLQRKAPGIKSHKMGLNNLASKYALLNQGSILITESATDFKVQVPLIKPSQYAGADC